MTDTTPSAPAQSVDALREALTEIYERPLPSQPMTDGGDELSWAHRQYAELRRIAKTALDASLTVAPPAEGWRTPKGWKLVPISPTPEMQRAGLKGLDEAGIGTCGCDQHEVWAEMVAAAPGAPS